MSVLKRKFLYGGAVFILVLSIVAFVFIPAFGGASTGKVVEFGKWNGKPIQYIQDSFFVRQVQALGEQMRSQGQEVNQFSYYQIMQTAFNSTVVRYAILDELKESKYEIPISIVDKNLIPYYQDANGKYSSKRFAETPETTRAARRSQVTEELTVQRYVNDVFGTNNGLFGLKTSSKETELIKTMSSPERSFNFVGFSTSEYPEEELAAFGKGNAGLFVNHSLSLITFDSEAAAKKAAQSIEKSEISFDDAVTTYSTRNGTDAVGKLTRTLRADLNNLFTDAADLSAVLELQPSAISKVVKAGSSWAIVRCDALPAEPDFTNKTVLSAVSAYMNAKERGIIEDYFMEKARAFTASARAKGFDAACAENGLAKKTTSPFAINYGNAEVLTPIPAQTTPELASAVRNESFFKTAFGLAPADVSDPVLLGNTVLVLQVAEEKAADAQITEMAPMFYSYYASTWSQKSLTDAFMKSEKLEDNFMKTYLENFIN